MVVVETVERHVIGPYRGRHIAGTSEAVVEVSATVECRFDDCVIRVTDVSAHYDPESGRQYVDAKVGVAIVRKVKETAATLHRHGPNGEPEQVQLRAGHILRAA